MELRSRMLKRNASAEHRLVGMKEGWMEQATTDVKIEFCKNRMKFGDMFRGLTKGDGATWTTEGGRFGVVM